MKYDSLNKSNIPNEAPKPAEQKMEPPNYHNVDFMGDWGWLYTTNINDNTVFRGKAGQKKLGMYMYYCKHCNQAWQLTDKTNRYGIMRFEDFPSYGLKRRKCKACKTWEKIDEQRRKEKK